MLFGALFLTGIWTFSWTVVNVIEKGLLTDPALVNGDAQLEKNYSSDGSDHKFVGKHVPDINNDQTEKQSNESFNPRPIFATTRVENVVSWT